MTKREHETDEQAVVPSGKTKAKRMVKGLLLTLVCLWVAAWTALFVLSGYIKDKAAPYILTPETAGEGYDCILVLGCGVRNNVPSPMLADRLTQGIALYNSGASEKLLMSGDRSGVEYDEVTVMEQYALDRGVPAGDVLTDPAGFSTYESMYRAGTVFQTKKVLVVTQDYHLYRAVYNARALGLDAYGVASDPREYGGQFYRDLRELLARSKDFLFCLFKPVPPG